MAKEHALTAWRRKSGKSQEAVGVALGVSRWMINRLENGKRTPSLDLALNIQDLTGNEVTPDSFAKPKHKEAAE